MLLNLNKAHPDDAVAVAVSAWSMPDDDVAPSPADTLMSQAKAMFLARNRARHEANLQAVSAEAADERMRRYFAAAQVLNDAS